jgi:hypothetical protein
VRHLEAIEKNKVLLRETDTDVEDSIAWLQPSPPAQRPVDQRLRPSTPRPRPHHGPSRGARSSVTRAARTTRSAPPWPQNWSSPCAHTPRRHPPGRRLVHKSAPADERTRRSHPYRILKPIRVIKVRSSSRSTDDNRRVRSAVMTAAPGQRSSPSTSY